MGYPIYHTPYFWKLRTGTRVPWTVLAVPHHQHLIDEGPVISNGKNFPI